MDIKAIDKATRVMEAPGDWKDGDKIASLSIRDLPTTEGNFMISEWQPTPEELELLNNGQSIKLWIRGVYHPVVALTVGEIEITE